MPAYRAAMVLGLAGALLSAGCSGSRGDDDGSGAQATEPATDAVPVDTVDAAAFGLDGEVDRVIAMVPPDAGAKRPLDVLGPGTVVLGGSHVLRAPMGDGKLMDFWILRVRSAQMGPGIMECKVMEPSDGSGSSAGCSSVGDAAQIPGRQNLVQGGMSDERWVLMEVAGPAETTHFIVTAGDQRIGVIPIEGRALVYLEGPCQRSMTISAWSGDEQLREEPANFC